MTDDEKKLRDAKAQDYANRNFGGPDYAQKVFAYQTGWDARADWQAERENSPDIRADIVSERLKNSVKGVLRYMESCGFDQPDNNEGDPDKAMYADPNAAYQDAQASDSSAEFPEASNEVSMAAWSNQNTVRKFLEAQLAEAHAEIERLRSHSNEK